MSSVLRRKLFSFKLFETKHFSSKILPKLDATTELKLKDSQIKPRRHPGIMDRSIISLPEPLLKAAGRLITDIVSDSNVLKQADLLKAHLRNKKPPISDGDLQALAVSFEAELESKETTADISCLTEEERNRMAQSRKDRVLWKLRHNVYHWKPISYDESMGIIYLLARLAPDYASVIRVLREIKYRDANFKPQTLFDFGSGVGSAVWAAGETWKDIKEKFCVDVSVEMNNLALRLMQGGGPLYSTENGAAAEPPKGVFFRQFLPASHALKYDLVISAHSLLELPSAEQRLKTVFSLWRKTQGYLVIVEQGSRAAYEVVVEARDFVLSLAESSNDPSLQGHVFAPCPHDLPCPRLVDTTPCNFTVNYEPLLANEKAPIDKEAYSYVVLKKGKRNEEDPQWPRIVRPVLARSRHIICRLCTKEGKLDELVLTAAKHGKELYRCGRKSDWGDLLPVDLVKVHKTKEPEIQETNQNDHKLD